MKVELSASKAEGKRRWHLNANGAAIVEGDIDEVIAATSAIAETLRRSGSVVAVQPFKPKVLP